MDLHHETTVSHTNWHGMEAIALAGNGVRAVFVPALGAKMVSLVHIASGHEWLVDPGQRRVQPVEYGAVFVEQDMSGWDEMFPTIEPCTMTDDNGQPVQLPDHGEVWALPWQASPLPSGVRFHVTGVALPYRLTRTARITAPGVLRFDYEVTNTATYVWPYIWAAHPQFTVTDTTRIVLPEHIDHVVTVADHPAWGEPGTVYAWPKAQTAGGKTWDLQTVGPATNEDYRKFYVPPEQTATWAGLHCQRTGRKLNMHWPAESVPYLGIWVDEGTYNPVPTAALEPATGYYDDVALAHRLGRAPLIAPGDTHSWWLEIRLA